MENYTYKIQDKKRNRVVYEVILTAEYFNSQVEKEFGKLTQNVKIAGFRPGKAPRKDLEARVMPDAVLKAYNSLLPKVAFEIVSKESLQPLGDFKYDLLEKELPDKAIGFTFSFLVKPEIALADFKKIKLEYKEEKVTKEEIDNVIKSMAQNTLSKEELEKFKSKENEEEIEITDNLVSALKYNEKTYSELKESIEKTLKNIKKQNADSTFSNALVKQLSELADFDIPEEMLNKQVADMEKSFKERLKSIKLDLAEYLATQGTDIEKQRAEWQKSAVTEIKSEIVIMEYAEKSNIIATNEEVEHELSHIKDPKQKNEFSTEEGKDYLKYALTRAKSFTSIIESAKSNTK